MNIIIIGATSGIGKELFRYYADGNNNIVVCGRRKDKLEEIKNLYSDKTEVVQLDVQNCEETVSAIQQAFRNQGAMDLAIVCAGVGDLNPNLDFSIEEPTIRTNIVGWTNVMDLLWNNFERQGYGHIVGISSAGGFRGEPMAPAYSASKAYQINYLEALRKKAAKSNHNIIITDIRPGLVDTKMAKGEGLFWVMPTDKVAHQIARAIKGKCRTKVVTKRWRFLSAVIRYMPNAIFDKM